MRTFSGCAGCCSPKLFNHVTQVYVKQTVKYYAPRNFQMKPALSKMKYTSYIAEEVIPSREVCHWQLDGMIYHSQVFESNLSKTTM